MVDVLHCTARIVVGGAEDGLDDSLIRGEECIDMSVAVGGGSSFDQLVQFAHSAL